MTVNPMGRYANGLAVLRNKFKNATIQRSTIKAVAVLKNSQSTYNLEINGNTFELPEIKLNDQDLFQALEMRVSIAHRDTVNSPNIFVPKQVPLADDFPANAGFNPKHLEVVFMGKLEIVVNNVAYYENFSTEAFRKAPSTQISTTNAITALEADHSQDGWVQMQPSVLFKGNNKNIIRITLPDTAGLTFQHTATGIENLVIVTFNGFLINP